MATRKYKTRKNVIGDALIKGFLGGWLLDEVKPKRKRKVKIKW